MKKNNNKELYASFEAEFEVKHTVKYISQNNYKDEMVSKVEPYLKERAQGDYIIGVNNVKLYYEKYITENAKANIVICHGLGEFIEKYNEIIYYFMRAGYSIFVIEHRGHGRSQRLGIDNSQVHIEKFQNYIEDFRKFMDEIVVPNSSDKKIFLFAHSMGGAIGTIFLEKYTSYFKAVILSAPMYRINTGKIPKVLANVIVSIMKLYGKEKNYLPGKAPYVDKKALSDKSTSCKERRYYLYEKIKNNDSYKSGGPSVLWYIESVRATKKLIRKENASKVEIPVLLFQGEYDTHVVSKAHDEFALYAKDCEIVNLKGAKHEVYFERDEITFCFLDRVLSFYEKNI